MNSLFQAYAQTRHWDHPLTLPSLFLTPLPKMSHAIHMKHVREQDIAAGRQHPYCLSASSCLQGTAKAIHQPGGCQMLI